MHSHGHIRRVCHGLVLQLDNKRALGGFDAGASLQLGQIAEGHIAKLRGTWLVARFRARLIRVGHAIAKLASPVQHSDTIRVGVYDDDFAVGQHGDRAARLDVASHTSAQLVTIDGRVRILVQRRLIAQRRIRIIRILLVKTKKSNFLIEY